MQNDVDPTALVELGDVAGLRSGLKKHPEWVAKDALFRDWSLLGRALASRHPRAPEMVGALLQGGADPEGEWLMQRRFGDGFFPLQWVVTHPRTVKAPQVVELLLRAGAQCGRVFKDFTGAYVSCLEYAKKQGRTEMAQVMLRFSQSARASTRQSSSPASPASPSSRRSSAASSLFVAWKELALGPVVGKGSFGVVHKCGVCVRVTHDGALTGSVAGLGIAIATLQ